VNVHDLWFLFAQEAQKIPPAVRSPDRSFSQTDLPKAAILLDLEVATLVKDDLMPGFLEHLGFLLENDVFAPGLLIGVMNEEYFQRKLSPFLLPAV
jgi:hypothetical protein